MKTNEELKAITAEGISEALTIPELAAIYNLHVLPENQVKKFRTKEQAIDRVLKALAANVVVVPETAEPIEITEQRCGAVILIDPPTYAETQQATLEGVNIDGTTPTDPVLDQPLPPINELKASEEVREVIAVVVAAPVEQKPRRKAVKGVAKIAMDLLRSGTDGENVISVVQRKYIDEGGYSEKDARANAQNILAYVKEKLQKESQVNTEANAQMDAASSAA